MLTKYITKWNEHLQKQSEVNEALTEKLLGVLYRVRRMVSDGHIGLVIPFVELGEIDDDSLSKFCNKICESPIFQNAAEALDKYGFFLHFEVELDKKRISLVVQKNTYSSAPN